MSDSIDAVFAGPDHAFSGVASIVSQVGATGTDVVSAPDMSGDPVREGLDRDLMKCATALTNDTAVARIVTDLALARMDRDAADQQVEGRDVEPPGQVTLFRMVRQAYHSIERTRVRRAPRPAVGAV